MLYLAILLWPAPTGSDYPRAPITSARSSLFYYLSHHALAHGITRCLSRAFLNFGGAVFNPQTFTKRAAHQSNHPLGLSNYLCSLSARLFTSNGTHTMVSGFGQSLSKSLARAASSKRHYCTRSGQAGIRTTVTNHLHSSGAMGSDVGGGVFCGHHYSNSELWYWPY